MPSRYQPAQSRFWIPAFAEMTKAADAADTA